MDKLLGIDDPFVQYLAQKPALANPPSKKTK